MRSKLVLLVLAMVTVVSLTGCIGEWITVCYEGEEYVVWSIWADRHAGEYPGAYEGNCVFPVVPADVPAPRGSDIIRPTLLGEVEQGHEDGLITIDVIGHHPDDSLGPLHLIDLNTGEILLTLPTPTPHNRAARYILDAETTEGLGGPDWVLANTAVYLENPDGIIFMDMLAGWADHCRRAFDDGDIDEAALATCETNLNSLGFPY